MDGLTDPSLDGTDASGPTLPTVDLSQIASAAAVAAINQASVSANQVIAAKTNQQVATINAQSSFFAGMSTGEKLIIILGVGALAMAALHVHVASK